MRQNDRMTATNLEAVERIALDIARADMHYVATSLVEAPSSAIAAEVALLQYGAMAAYEAQVHFGKTLGWRLETEWDPDTAKAARMSGKFFADTKRSFHGIVSHFDDLLLANHGVFFPSNRRSRFLDFLRDDMSVVTLGGTPYTSLVSAHYLTGLSPEQVGDSGIVSSAIRRLSTGVGNIAGLLLNDSGIAWHQHAPSPPFEWFDGKSKIALPRLFGGRLLPSTAVALLTIQSVSVSAARSAQLQLCPWCEAAARKRRFIVLFQSLTALTIMRANGGLDSRSEEALAFLDDPESVWVLAQSKLRNGLVHLGLQDIAAALDSGSTVDDVVRAYTRQDSNVVATRVAKHLRQFVEHLTTWMLSPTLDGGTFLAALHRAPPG